MVIEQINVHWFQKAREKAIYDGDCNTVYYHASATIRRKNNKIEGLQNQNDDWIWEEEWLRIMVINYFHLYSEETPTTMVSLPSSCFPSISDVRANSLAKPFTNTEINLTLR